MKDSHRRPDSIPDSEIVQQLLVAVLCCQAGVGKVAVHPAPFSQPPVIEDFEIFGDDERDYVVGKTFLEHHLVSYNCTLTKNVNNLSQTSIFYAKFCSNPTEKAEFR